MVDEEEEEEEEEEQEEQEQEGHIKRGKKIPYDTIKRRIDS